MPTLTPPRRGPRESGSPMPALRDRFRRRCGRIRSSPISGIFTSPLAGAHITRMQMRLQKRYSSGVNFLAAYTLSKSLVSGGGYTGLGDDAAGSRPLDTANRKIEKTAGRLRHAAESGVVLGLRTSIRPRQAVSFQRRPRREPDRRRLAGQRHPAVRFRHSHRGWRWRGDSAIERRQPAQRRARRLAANQMCRVGISTRRVTATSTSTPSLNRRPSPSGTRRRCFRTCALSRSSTKTSAFSRISGFYETHRIQFRAEFFDIFNRVVFGAPGTNINAPATFGKIGGQANSPRNIQLGLKYVF